MESQLILNVRKDLVKKAKHYAKSQGLDLSKLIENYLDTLLEGTPESLKEEGSITNKLWGSFKTKKKLDYKKVIGEERIKKYGS